MWLLLISELLTRSQVNSVARQRIRGRKGLKIYRITIISFLKSTVIARAEVLRECLERNWDHRYCQEGLSSSKNKQNTKILTQ